MGRGSIWNKDSGLIAGWILKAYPLECSVTDFEMFPWHNFGGPKGEQDAQTCVIS